MRSLTICFVTLAVVIVLTVQPVMALTVMSVPYVRAGPVWSLTPAQYNDLFILETRTSSLAADSTAAFAVSFEPSGVNTMCGPVISPAIAQTSSQSIACSSSYFFKDFLAA